MNQVTDDEVERVARLMHAALCESLMSLPNRKPGWPTPTPWDQLSDGAKDNTRAMARAVIADRAKFATGER